MDVQTLVLNTLKGSKVAMKSAEIATKAGIEKTEVDKAIKALKKAEKDHFSKGLLLFSEIGKAGFRLMSTKGQQVSIVENYL